MTFKTWVSQWPLNSTWGQTHVQRKQTFIRIALFLFLFRLRRYNRQAVLHQRCEGWWYIKLYRSALRKLTFEFSFPYSWLLLSLRRPVDALMPCCCSSVASAGYFQFSPFLLLLLLLPRFHPFSQSCWRICEETMRVVALVRYIYNVFFFRCSTHTISTLLDRIAHARRSGRSAKLEINKPSTFRQASAPTSKLTVCLSPILHSALIFAHAQL